MSSALTYARFELLRTFRSGRFFVFSLIFPLIKAVRSTKAGSRMGASSALGTRAATASPTAPP
jgi:hypothetical protein